MLLKRGISQLIDMIEKRVFVSSEQTSMGKEQDVEAEERTLMPPLNDELVLHRIWPLLHRRVSVSLLWRLRRVNRAWKRKIGTTVEWSALEMVRIDSPGFLRFLAANRVPRPSLSERVENERAAISILLAEHLVDFTERSELNLSEVDSLESVAGLRGPVEMGAREPARKLSYCSPSTESVYSESNLNRGRSSYYLSEEEEMEAYASSTDSSMGVYYPRHSMRVG